MTNPSGGAAEERVAALQHLVLDSIAGGSTP
jgi:hypothetical protein